MKLVRGNGAPGLGACWMEAVNHYNSFGQAKWSDHPECVDPVIRRLCIGVNDYIETDEERESYIGPVLLDPAGTNVGIEKTIERARFCASKVLHLWDAPEVVKEFLRTGSGAKEATTSTAYADTTSMVTTSMVTTSIAAASNAANAAYYAAVTAIAYPNTIPATYTAANASSAALYAAISVGNNTYTQHIEWYLTTIAELCAMSPRHELNERQAAETLMAACLHGV